MSIVSLGLALTAYCVLSFVLFFVASPTINGVIIYMLVLPILYGVLLLGSWAFILNHRPGVGYIKGWLFGVILLLQMSTMVVSPGNCYGTKSHGLCYSNLQVLVGNVPRTGPSEAPHWTLVENSFPGFLLAYGGALVVGVWRTIAVQKK